MNRGNSLRHLEAQGPSNPWNSYVISFLMQANLCILIQNSSCIWTIWGLLGDLERFWWFSVPQAQLNCRHGNIYDGAFWWMMTWHLWNIICHMKYQLTSHQEWWNETYEWWLVDKSWWTSANEEPSLAAETSENSEKPAAKDTRLKDGWKRCLPHISMAMSEYTMYMPHSPTTPFFNQSR